MKDFRKLNAWNKSHILALSIYHVSNSFPKEEVYGLTSQMRRAGASIPTNIAEGCGREGDAEFGRFLQILIGSASELEYLLLLANELRFINSEIYNNLDNQVNEVKRMLITLVQKMKKPKA
jgi:four helix bundle protein